MGADQLPVVGYCVEQEIPYRGAHDIMAGIDGEIADKRAKEAAGEKAREEEKVVQLTRPRKPTAH
jgi:hypothetical protein